MSGHLLLFDRGYPGFWLMYLLLQKGAGFVMRVQRNACNAVKSLNRLRATGMAVSREASIRVRTVKVLPDTGETEVLITGLYDSTEYTKEDLKEVYRLRRGVETGYGYLKEGLQLGQLSGIRSVCIEQDFAAALCLFILQSLTGKAGRTSCTGNEPKKKVPL
jgi:hypothetical protein